MYSYKQILDKIVGIVVYMFKELHLQHNSKTKFFTNTKFFLFTEVHCI